MAEDTRAKREVLALVPARGGSKSIPRKNLQIVSDKPMIAHSIGHALLSQHITRVVVTTDDEEIAGVARQHGAEVPFLRPAELADDLSTDYGFVRHALEWLRDAEGYEPDLVVQLRPTTPLRDPRLIDRAIETLWAHPAADSLRAVVKACFTPYKMWRLGEDGLLSQLLDLEGYSEPYNQPRQVLPEVYQQDAFIDITRPRTIFERNSITGRTILPFFLEQQSLDIDESADLIEADQRMSPMTGARGIGN